MARTWRHVVVAMAVAMAASNARAAISEVSGQRATQTAGGVDSTTLAFPANVASGNLLVVSGAVWASGGAPASVTVTDTRSTSYTVLSVAFATEIRIFIAYGITSSAGANTVTVNPAGTTADIGFSIDEFSEVDTTTPLDVDGGSSTGTSTSPSDSLTTTSADALVIGTMSWSGATTTVTPGGSYTQIGENESTANAQPFNSVFRLVTTATSYTVDYTLGASRAWGVYTAAFKPAAGAAPPAPLRRKVEIGGCESGATHWRWRPSEPLIGSCGPTAPTQHGRKSISEPPMVDTIVTNTTAGDTTISATVASATNDMVWGLMMAFDITGVTPGAGQTELWDVGSSTELRSSASNEAGASSVTHSYSWTGTRPAGIAATNINQATGGAQPPLRRRVVI